MAVYNWSQTAATNASADANINWAEGQAPSSVNDSARALMAAVAKWRDDNAGTLTTGGTTTAYTLSSNQVFDTLAHMAGQTLRVIMNATNTGATTLNVDGLGAKSVVAANGSALGAGDLVSGCVYGFVYDNVNGIWVVHGGAPGAFASGTIVAFQQTSAPTGWTKNTTHNDKALRVVTGTASSGGSTAFTSIMTSRTIAQANLPSYTLSNTLGVASHSHGLTTTMGSFLMGSGAGATHTVLLSNVEAASYAGTTDAASPSITGSVTSGGSNTAMDFAVQYVDLILATKN